MKLLAFFIILAASLITVMFPIYLDYRRRQSSWIGVVEDKGIKDYYYRGMHSIIYQLYVLKENGEKLNFTVNETVYSSINIGDRIKKEKGQFYPLKF